MPAQSRVSIWVDAEELPAGSGQRPLADGSVSTAVHVTNGIPVIVERTMWWPGPAITGDFWYEAHNSPGATGTALQWAIGGAEIAGADEADTYVLIANTADRQGRVQIQTLSDGRAGFRNLALPAKSRTTVSLRSMLPQGAGVYGVLIESIAPSTGGSVPVPIVVERATYASPGGVFWESGGNALATPVP